MKRYLALLAVGMCVHGFASYSEERMSDEALIAQEEGDVYELVTGDLVDEEELSQDAIDSRKGKKHKHGKWAKVKRVCSKVKPDDAQKKALKDAALAYKKEMKTLKAAVKAARGDYEKLVLEKSATVPLAETSGSKVVEAKGKILVAKQAFTTTLLFTVLKAEQRPAGLACLKAIQHAKRHHGHHHHGHQQQQQQQQQQHQQQQQQGPGRP